MFVSPSKDYEVFQCNLREGLQLRIMVNMPPFRVKYFSLAYVVLIFLDIHVQIQSSCKESEVEASQPEQNNFRKMSRNSKAVSYTKYKRGPTTSYQKP
jgi:hypothetical protein